nr:hypothetical protein Iba_chr11bCG8560 [Ipomoea batatas]
MMPSICFYDWCPHSDIIVVNQTIHSACKKKTRPREIKEQTNRLAVVSQSCTSELFKPIAICLPSGAHLTLVTGPFSSSIVTSSEVLPSDASHSHYEPPPEECDAWVSLVWPGKQQKKLIRDALKRGGWFVLKCKDPCPVHVQCLR